jgi:tetratricopeptide (TPR) repeat protein
LRPILLVGAALFLLLMLAPGPAAAAPGEDETAEEALDPDYAGGRKAIESRDWAGAIRLLSLAALRDTRNADIQNYLGFAYRSSGDLPLAFKHYHRALQLNARHRGAHEYLGEAYLMIGNLDKAAEHLALLGKICLIPCEEYGMLARKIAEYRARTASTE